MSYAPVELRHIPLKRRLLGYDRAAVDAALVDIADSYEFVWRERAELADRVEQLEGEVARNRDLEHLLRATLVSAEQAAQNLKEQGKAEAVVLVREARSEATEITRRARTERETLLLEARKIRLLLHAALDAIDEAEIDEGDAASSLPGTGEAAAPAVEAA